MCVWKQIKLNVDKVQTHEEEENFWSQRLKKPVDSLQQFSFEFNFKEETWKKAQRFHKSSLYNWDSGRFF